jgi:hypothetical protein
MTNKIIIRPEAEREVQGAFDWYEELSACHSPASSPLSIAKISLRNFLPC